MNLPSTNTLGSDLSGITNVLCQAIFCQIRMVCNYLKYFLSVTAVKIGKKKCSQSFVNKCKQMIDCTFFLPIFTAATDKKYFSCPT